ncbi:hypothetical protein [Flavihumibacter profundi]|uniref:hypothetical protein n=1 Tax=Flavihumibacter profundi TaxID=2716883 RepID=UPI001CC4FAA6|nr:hypothetical protein [Flavihumibacter profundi]MBZ5859485.1 hypothetical protein [Flavihumibacter profundi]
MKKIFTTAMLGFCLHMAMAQEGGKMRLQDGVGPDRHRQPMDFKALHLTEDQQNKMAELRKEQQAKMMAILTPEQRKQLGEQKAGRKLENEKRSAERMEKMKEKLNLSADQSTKMTQLDKDFRQKAEVIRANDALAAAEQRRQLKALVEAHKSDMKAMLNPDQQSILDEMKSRRNKGQSR